MDLLKKRSNIIITSIDKEGIIVVTNNDDYLENCTGQLNEDEFYQKIEKDPTPKLIEKIEKEMKYMKESEFFSLNFLQKQE